MSTCSLFHLDDRFKRQVILLCIGDSGEMSLTQVNDRSETPLKVYEEPAAELRPEHSKETPPLGEETGQILGVVLF
jgi:hypothetical protein